MNRGFAHLLLLTLGCVLGSDPVMAAKSSPAPASATRAAPQSAELADKQSDLSELRGKIDGLRKDLVASEGHRSEAADKLRESEQQISTLQRELRQLSGQRDRLEATIDDLGRQARELEATLQQQQQQLERLVKRQYLQGNPDTLQLLLNGGDANQMARDMVYIAAVGKARATLLDGMRTTLARKKQVAADAQERADELAEVAAQQQRHHAELSRQREQRKVMLAQISDKVNAQRREISNLQENEKRLSQLIDRLGKVLAEQASRAARAAKAEQAAKAAKAAQAAQQAAVARPGRGDEHAGAAKAGGEPPRAASKPAPVAEVENAHLPEASKGVFASLRGSLRLPARGNVTGKFGAAREGGGTWKGLFIRATSGSEVKAVAAGRVVFSEWMRGFGNLLIIDHGDAYLSIYGNNDSLLKQVGDPVKGGETIAAVGNSGGNPDSGLYFEIRHQGQPIDPMKWASLK